METEEKLVINRITRLLLDNHTKDTKTSKRNIISEYSVNRGQFVLLMDQVQQNLRALDFSLVGVEGNRVINYKQADKFFIVCEDKSHQNKRPRISRPADLQYELMIVIFVIIYVEREIIGVKRLINYLKRIEILDEKEITNILQTMKRKGYIAILKDDEDTIAKYSWRFYAEFPDFNPLKSLTMMKENKKKV